MEASDEMQCLWEWDKSLIFPFNAIHFFFTVQLLSTWKWLFISGCPDKECAALSGFGRDAQKGALGRSRTGGNSQLCCPNNSVHFGPSSFIFLLAYYRKGEKRQHLSHLTHLWQKLMLVAQENQSLCFPLRVCQWDYPSEIRNCKTRPWQFRSLLK